MFIGVTLFIGRGGTLKGEVKKFLKIAVMERFGIIWNRLEL